MRITIEQLKKTYFIDKAIIHSADLSLYFLSVELDGQEYVVVDKTGRALRSHNKLDLQQVLQMVSVNQVVLRHSSAYDEMVGQPVRVLSNQLEVPLGNADMGFRNPNANKPLH
jgi:hypothetical protein